MNERIQELADRIWAEEYWNNPNTDRLLPAQLNKFAEMIVRECASFVNEFATNGDVRTGNDLLEHFGVEE